MKFQGMKVVVNKYLTEVPKLSIDPLFEWVTPRVRSEIDLYLLETFGADEKVVIYDPPGGERVLLVSPRTLIELQRTQHERPNQGI